MQWLREHMRNHVDTASIEPTEKVLNFRPAPAGPPKSQETEAVELVYQAADVIRGAQDRAAQVEAAEPAEPPAAPRRRRAARTSDGEGENGTTAQLSENSKAGATPRRRRSTKPERPPEDEPVQAELPVELFQAGE